jgi:hypothetical protein
MSFTPFQTLYIAAQAIMTDAIAVGAGTITVAPSDYGDDFLITPGAGVYQVQVTPREPVPLSSNESYPRATVTVLIHHYAASESTNQQFTLNMMNAVADRLTVASYWRAQFGIYDLDHDEDPEISEASRSDNVTTFEITATVLMDAV